MLPRSNRKITLKVQARQDDLLTYLHQERNTLRFYLMRKRLFNECFKN